MNPYIIPGLNRRTVTPDILLETVADFFHISSIDVVSGKVKKARWAFLWYWSKKLNAGPVEITKYVRSRFKTFISHMTVIHSSRRLENLMSSNPAFSNDMRVLMGRISGVVAPAPELPEPKHNPVEKILFNPDWLEKFIQSFFGLSDDFIQKQSSLAIDRKFKYVGIAIMAAYSGSQLSTLATKYNIKYQTLYDQIQKGIMYDEYKQISDELKALSHISVQ